MAKFTRNLLAYLSETDVDGTSVGNTTLTTTISNNGQPDFRTLLAVVQVLQQANVLTGATVNVGTNSPNFNNIVSGQSVGGVTGMIVLPLASGAAPAPLNTAITVRVSVAATPVPLTTVTLLFRVALLGFDVES